MSNDHSSGFDLSLAGIDAPQTLINNYEELFSNAKHQPPSPPLRIHAVVASQRDGAEVRWMWLSAVTVP